MRRSLVVLALALVAGALVAPASGAAPAGPADRSPAAADPARPLRPALADLDGDGVSDELGARLARLAAGERLPAIVLHDGSVTAAAARRAVGAFPAGARFTTIDGFAAPLTRGQVRALAALPGVTRVQGDAIARTADASSDADYGAATARTAFGVTGAGAGICVLDTGADPGHEQLAGRIARFRDFVGTATAPYDDQGHGTHVASIAAGDGTGGPDAAPNAGVAPGASLIVGKVLNAQGSGTTSQIVAGIEWCAGLSDVDVITMSLATSAGSDGQDALSLAANAAADAGKVVTAAAGNAGDLPMSIGAPGAAQGVVTVGAGTDWSAPVGAPNHDDG
ncbi:MAG TPA: S8 family serine peptidase, partial [Actinomycetota bacterium]